MSFQKKQASYDVAPPPPQTATIIFHHNSNEFAIIIKKYIFFLLKCLLEKCLFFTLKTNSKGSPFLKLLRIIISEQKRWDYQMDFDMKGYFKYSKKV